ncbi:unnamed protein product [Rangifer tarandus platyrhynchus]|uniref:Uncharacterized protein n=1 Tax=Rangifer tarandus platyrhynchus TaxID=3082113 RepID=A0AC59ZLW7_RANTA
MTVSQSCPTLQPHGLQSRQAPLSMGFSRQEYRSGLPFPLGDLPKPGIQPESPTLQTDSLPYKPPGKPLQVDRCMSTIQINALKFREYSILLFNTIVFRPIE